MTPLKVACGTFQHMIPSCPAAPRGERGNGAEVLCEDDRPAPSYGWQGSQCPGLATVDERDLAGDLGIQSDSSAGVLDGQ